MAKKGGMFAALFLGKKKPMMGEGMEDDMESKMDSKSDDYGDMPPEGFEEEAVAAFPDMEGSPERIDAFWRAVKACVGG